MARAATGLTEVACWQFIGAGIGGVAALMFFLIVGAMNGMEPKPKTAEKVAPLFVRPTCLEWDPANSACVALKDTIDGKLTDDVKAALLASPCDLDISDVIDDLGFYWQARCGKVYTGRNCYAEAEADRPGCEQTMARLEASCAFLGLANDPMSLMPDDLQTPDQCLDALKGNTVTQGQADRCASSPSMAWETLNFMTGGDYVTTNRCGAVTFAAVVNQGTILPTCESIGDYNAVAGNTGAANDALCTAERLCNDDLLRSLVDDVPRGKAETILADGSFETWTRNDATKVTTTTCERGWEARAGTDGYFCSHVPYTDDDGYPIAADGARITDVDQSIGTWVGGLKCKRRSCPPKCGSELGLAITGDGTRTTQRDPPEGLTDTCCSGVLGDTCQIQCDTGYEPYTDGNGPLPHTCEVLGADTQAEPQWNGASCVPSRCYTKPIPNVSPGGGAANRQASGTVGQRWGTGLGENLDVGDELVCANNYFAVGELACQPNLFFQGGGCSNRPAAAVIEPSVFAAATVSTSSNSGLARDAFDNNPLTYWYSTVRTMATVADPVWVQITLESSVVPLGFSIQLGKSPDFSSFFVKPKNLKVQGKLNQGVWQGFATDVTVANGAINSAFMNLPEEVVWYPPCNDVSIDPIGCSPGDGAEIPCPFSPPEECNPSSGAGCNYPVASPQNCGPTEFPIRSSNSGEYNQFRLLIESEFLGTDASGNERTERYGTIYVQDFFVSTAATIRSRANPNSPLVTFTPEELTCCGPSGACGATEYGTYEGTTWSQCVGFVTAETDSDVVYMQFNEGTDGTGTCYGIKEVDLSRTGVSKRVTQGGLQGAMCWAVNR